MTNCTRCGGTASPACDHGPCEFSPVGGPMQEVGIKGERAARPTPGQRAEFEMSISDLSTLLESMRPVPCMMIGTIAPRSQQENANAAWCALGDRMGFDGMTVQPSGKGDRFFTAVARATTPATNTEGAGND